MAAFVMNPSRYTI